jgi:hypothetical protein
MANSPNAAIVARFLASDNPALRPRFAAVAGDALLAITRSVTLLSPDLSIVYAVPTPQTLDVVC